ncbi:MAG: ATP-binding protein [Bacteroidota bacterium]
MNQQAANRLVIPLEKESDVGIARDEARAVAQAMGFDDLATAEVALGVSEICQNAIRHAGGGRAIITTANNDKILQIEVSDKGNGISNVTQAMQEGYSTIKTSLGVGLEAAQRSVDHLEVITKKDSGTTILLEKYLPISPSELEFGVASLPDEAYDCNGDDYLVYPFDGDKVLLAVIDGLGQGKVAHQMAVGVKRVLATYFTVALKDFILLCS